MKLYAMDTCFYHAMGNYRWSARCEMLKELGYDATYITLFGEEEWGLLELVADNEKKYGLPVEAVYATPESGSIKSWQRVADEVLPALGDATDLEIAILRPSREAGDEKQKAIVIEGLTLLLEAARRSDTRIRLYPHIDFWLSHTSRAMELVREINHPLLGVMFCGFHWYAGDATPLGQLLDDAGSKLFGANICGSRAGGMVYGYTVEPLDRGQMDNFLVMAELLRHGYQGPIGLQGYSCGGDVYDNLARSIKAFRSIEKRLEDHPEWGDYDPHTPSHLARFRGTAPV